ncbi:Short-chain dehydrogenase/reductase SDR [Corchorus olitorius]|uniref:Short-chain dehydrogenase/reductase SDR n=1 Tax=Corchorus olitorius TaxID=93759 RepID=A0A1R3GKJ3_9ROSI|nr:Short-chain dehydrogenase/reductase SDR [Corchorus olitorius]
MRFFGWKGPSGFSSSSTAEEVTQGIDGTGLTAIVTGASSGIGLETARVLALRGVHVVMAVRNVEAGKNAKEAILKEIADAKIDVMELDLSSMASVRKFVSNYQSSSLPLNLLINNAGVLTPTFMLSQDNIELSFATNHLARESNREGRIVNLSSLSHHHPYREGIRFDNINDQSGYYGGWFAYGQSKLANILHAKELARRLKEEGVEITANSVHPGTNIRTNILRDRSFIKALNNIPGPGKFFFKSVPQGAATTCYVALHPQVKGVTGEYFADCNVANTSSKAKDADLAKRLWDFSLTFTNPK